LVILGNILYALLTTTPLYNDELPPEKFQGTAVPTIVISVDDPNTEEACGVAQPGWVLLACEYVKKHQHYIKARNPCMYPEAKQKGTYAHDMCHEFGHVNGWNGTHNN
jgi:hypothetical protein